MAERQTLGQYHLGEKLASGGMAEIFHATCVDARRFDCPIVLKRMHSHLANDADFVSMFVDEARISTRLDHPNIVRLLDFQANAEGLYIILEYVDGPDLLSLLKGAARRRTTMPAEIATYIACHVLEALDYAHTMEIDGRALEVVHRDVSPGNILISQQGRVKLTDFGIARANDRQEKAKEGTLKGKFGYMSPEQVEAEKLDGRSDVFSAGIVLAELLMSKRLFRSPNPLDVLLMVRSGNLARLEKYGSHIEPALLSIILKALARDRDERYATAAEFRDALTDWLARGKQRMSTAILKGYIDDLTKAGFVRPASPGEETSSVTMSGTATRAISLAATNAAGLGRKLFAEGGASNMNLILGAAGVTLITERPEVLQEIEEEYEDITVDTPLEASAALDSGHGGFGILLPLDLVGAIALGARTGLLTLEQELVDKQAYFVQGHPVFVASNDPQERFGQFLVQKGHITQEQLTRAIATMPHFGGRLGQALVGLELIKAVDTVRLLAEQISDKLLRSCCWEQGHFVWQEGEQNPYTSVSLHLSSYRIIARGVQRIPEERLRDWVLAKREIRPNLAMHAPFDAYGFGPSLSSRLLTMDGSRSLGSLIDSVSEQGRRIMSCAAYALMISQKI